MPKEKTVRIKFNNLESPGFDLHFSYGGESYELIDGKEYTLPVSVINHLNSRATPIYKDVEDPDRPGYFRSVPDGARPRFSCQPVDFNAFAVTGPYPDPAPKKKAGRPKKDAEQGDENQGQEAGAAA